MLVVADSSLLSARCRIGRIDLLRELFGHLILSQGFAGEAEASALAHDRKADVILLDDKKGRRQAEALGLSCLALPAIIVAAKRKCLIPSVADAFALLAAKRNYRVAVSTVAVSRRSVSHGCPSSSNASRKTLGHSKSLSGFTHAGLAKVWCWGP